MFFTEKELYDCANFKGLAHWYFQSWFLRSSNVCNSYYYNHEVNHEN